MDVQALSTTTEVWISSLLREDVCCCGKASEVGLVHLLWRSIIHDELSLQGHAPSRVVHKELRCTLSDRIGTIAALIMRSKLADLRL